MSPTLAPLRERVVEALSQVIDPEIGLNVVELGLVYGVEVSEASEVRVELTMTTPACPLAEQIVRDAEDRILGLQGVAALQVRLVWDPPWTPERMSASAKALLGW